MLRTLLYFLTIQVLFQQLSYAQELELGIPIGHTHSVLSVSFSPDGRYVLSSSVDKTLKLWDVSTGKMIRSFEEHSNWVYSVTFSPDGKYALSGSDDNTLKLWDVSSGKLIRSFDGHSGDVNTVSFNPDGRLALSGSDDNTQNYGMYQPVK